MVTERLELHKVAPTKVIAKDKTVILAKKDFTSILRPGKKKRARGKGADVTSTIGATSAMDTTLLTDGDDLGMELDDGLNMDATMNADGIEIGEDGEPIEAGGDGDDMEGDGDGGEGEDGKDEEGGDAEEEKEEGGEGEGAGENKADDANAEGPTSPTAKKLKKGLSKSSKKTKSKDEDAIEMVTWKPSATVKGRLVVGEPMKTPEVVTQHI